MTNDFNILASFTRSYDKHHTNTNLHLIASTILIRGNSDLKDLIENRLSNLLKDNNINMNIVIVYANDYNIDENQQIKDSNKVRYKEFLNFNVLLLSIDQLFRINLDNKDLNETWFKTIFNYENSETKNINQIYTHTYFIFTNIVWSNIVFTFKINNVDISGGGSTTRHLLNSSDINLCYFLNLMYNNFETIKKIGYNSYKNEKDLLSSQIPFKLYQDYLSKLTKIHKLPANDLLKNLSKLLESSNSITNEYIKIIASNILMIRKVIIDLLLDINKKNLLLKIEKLLVEKKSEYDSYSLQYGNLISRTRHMSNKSKKKLKKEKQNILNSGLTPDKLRDILSRLDLEISELKNNLDQNNQKLIELENNLKTMDTDKLFTLYKNENNRIDYRPINLKRRFFTKYKNTNIRTYSTYSLNKNSYLRTNFSGLINHPLNFNFVKYTNNYSSIKYLNNIKNNNYSTLSYAVNFINLIHSPFLYPSLNNYLIKVTEKRVYFSSSSISYLNSNKDLINLNSPILKNKNFKEINYTTLDFKSLKTKEVITVNYNLKSFYFPYPFSLAVFIKLLILTLSLNSNYTILFQYHKHQGGLIYIYTRQCGIFVKDSHDINYYISLYYFFIENLNTFTSLYNIELPDIIIINIKKIILNKNFLLDNIKNISLNKSITKIVKTKSNFSN
jgi:hypothetical protein